MWNKAWATQGMRGPTKSSPPQALSAGTPTSGLPTLPRSRGRRVGPALTSHPAPGPHGSPGSPGLTGPSSSPRRPRHGGSEDATQVSSPVPGKLSFQILLSDPWRQRWTPPRLEVESRAQSLLPAPNPRCPREAGAQLPASPRPPVACANTSQGSRSLRPSRPLWQTPLERWLPVWEAAAGAWMGD